MYRAFKSSVATLLKGKCVKNVKHNTVKLNCWCVTITKFNIQGQPINAL